MFKRMIQALIPDSLIPLALNVYFFLRSLRYIGDNRICPICGWHFRRFMPAGRLIPRPEAECPRCCSRERHRLYYLYLKERTNFFLDNLKVLHIAPEYSLRKVFLSMPQLNYLSIDLKSRLAMISMDATDIHMPDNTIDVVLCSHVLEHVPEDRKAMRELYRVLKPGGWAIIQVPINTSLEETFEDSMAVSPHERERLFGQDDHVRKYGLDYKERLEEAGFAVKVDDYFRELGADKIRLYGLTEENIYFCVKPDS